MEIFSEYFIKDNFLSKVDARIKLLVAFTVLIMVLSYKGFIFPLVLTLLSLFLCMKMKIPLRIFALRFCEPLFIASCVLILKCIFSTNYQDGLWDGLVIASRILGAVSIVIAVGFSMPFGEFIASLSWLKIPQGFIEILMFAYRYIFMLLEDARVIYNAQKNRLGYSNLKRGLNSFGILSGSLILKAFQQSYNITTAMMQRGYDGHISRLKHRPFKSSEVILSMMIITALGFIWKIL